MKRTLSLITLTMLLFILVCAPLSSCSSKDQTVLYVYNWGEYISDGSEGTLDTNKEFENYCKEVLGLNVSVNYSTYSSNESMYAKVSSGSAVYDVIIPSDYMIARMIQEDIQSNIGNAGLRAPVLKSVITSEAYKQAHPELYTFANNMLDGSVRGLPVFIHNQMDLWDAVGDAFNSILTTDQDITAALTTAQGAMEKANQPNK